VSVVRLDKIKTMTHKLENILYVNVRIQKPQTQGCLIKQDAEEYPST
jgi:hypothetical protein